MPSNAMYNISTCLPPQPPAARNFATYKCNVLRSNVPTKKRYRVIQYRSALVAPLLTRKYCTTTACQAANLTSKLTSAIPWSKLQQGTTCCNAYIEAATTGSSPAMVTPSQIVVTAATAVAHSASIKSRRSRAPPAIRVSCCAVHASTRGGTTACVVDSVLLA